ncbi:MAG TPA: DinB family protein [Planctomycetota bacterium]|nr:DinB family protein [Planctomycetota bacterium]
MSRTACDCLQQAIASEAQRTLRVLSVLTPSTLGYRAVAHQRSLGEVAWHMVQAVGSIASQLEWDVKGPAKGDPVPEEPSQIQARYEQVIDGLLAHVGLLADKDLDDEVAFYGESASRGAALRILLDHEIHHRGGLVILMRQAGLPPPPIYGPSGPAPDSLA